MTNTKSKQFQITKEYNLKSFNIQDQCLYLTKGNFNSSDFIKLSGPIGTKIIIGLPNDTPILSVDTKR